MWHLQGLTKLGARAFVPNQARMAVVLERRAPESVPVAAHAAPHIQRLLRHPSWHRLLSVCSTSCTRKWDAFFC